MLKACSSLLLQGVQLQVPRASLEQRIPGIVSSARVGSIKVCIATANMGLEFIKEHFKEHQVSVHSNCQHGLGFHQGAFQGASGDILDQLPVSCGFFQHHFPRSTRIRQDSTVVITTNTNTSLTIVVFSGRVNYRLLVSTGEGLIGHTRTSMPLLTSSL